MTYLLPLIIAACASVGVKRKSVTVIKMAVIIDAVVMLTSLLAMFKTNPLPTTFDTLHRHLKRW